MSFLMTTLCFFLRRHPITNVNQILLAKKKRGFGIGKWNGIFCAFLYHGVLTVQLGPGGKFDPSLDKNIEETAVRECIEEVGLEALDIKFRGRLQFWFKSNPTWNNDCHLFVSHSWKGEPMESEEMIPQWWDIDKIPFDQMWQDDQVWLPDLLQNNQPIHYTFWYNEENLIEKWNKEAV